MRSPRWRARAAQVLKTNGLGCLEVDDELKTSSAARLERPANTLRAAILNRPCRLGVNFDRCRRHVRFYPRNRPFQGSNRRCSVIAELLSPESFFQAAFMPSAGTTPFPAPKRQTKCTRFSFF